MEVLEAPFAARAVSVSVDNQQPAACFNTKDWTQVHFIPPSGIPNLYLSFSVPLLANGNPTLKLIGGQVYIWLLPPDTRVFVASDSSTAARIDFMLSPAPFNKAMLAPWKILTREVVDVLMYKALGDIWKTIKAIKPTTTPMEKAPRETIFGHAFGGK